MPGVVPPPYQHELFLLCKAMLPCCLLFLYKEYSKEKNLYLGTQEQLFKWQLRLNSNT